MPDAAPEPTSNAAPVNAALFTFSGAINFEEYLEYHKTIAAKRRTWLRSVLFLYGAGTIAVFPERTRLVILGSVLVLYAVVISPIQFRYRVRKNFENSPGAQRPRDLSIFPDGVVVMDDKGNPAHSNWNNFTGYRETELLFMLYHSPMLASVLPKRLLTEGSVSTLREFLASVFQKPARGGDPSAGAGKPE